MVGDHDGEHGRLRRLIPVTVAGEIAASVIMAIGVLTLAVVTAQVASSFVDQSSRRTDRAATEPGGATMSMADLAQRLARIEELLSGHTPPNGSS